MTIPDLEAIVDLFLEMNGLKMKGETGPLIAMLKEMVPISLARSSVLGTESGGTSSLSPTPPTPSEAQKKN